MQGQVLTCIKNHNKSLIVLHLAGMVAGLFTQKKVRIILRVKFTQEAKK